MRSSSGMAALRSYDAVDELCQWPMSVVVKPENTRCEQIPSVVHPTTDI
jgi:hypothetical protein